MGIKDTNEMKAQRIYEEILSESEMETNLITNQFALNNPETCLLQSQNPAVGID